MAGLADFEVPSYLQPISPVQQAQINVETANVGIRAAEQQQQARMQQQLMQQRDIEMKQRLSDIMERKQTMAKIQADAMRYSAMPNMDPQSALDHAMLDNAGSIWKDHPESMAQGTEALMKRIRHHDAVGQFRADSNALLSKINPKTGEKYTQEEATMEAYWKNIGDLDETATAPGALIGTQISRFETAEWHRAMQERLRKQFEESEAGRQKRFEEGEAGRQKRFQEGEKGKESRQGEAEKGKDERETQRLLSIDKTLIDLRKRREDLQKKLDARAVGPSPMEKLAGSVPGASKLGIGTEAFDKQTKKMEDDLEKLDTRIAESEAKIRGKSSQPTIPKATTGQSVRLGTLVEQEGKRYRYQGGDVNDPASWVEVK